jgi:enoyl-CoA hydratase/carnithine racemase
MDGPRSRPADTFAFRSIRYEKSPPVGRITINRPQVLNALDFAALQELSRAFEDASWDDGVAVVVLTGAGDRAFCTGADLEEQAGFLRRPRDYWKWMGAFIEAQERLRNIGKVTIARLNGMVVGGGNEFNMACDLAVAADDVIIRQVGTARGSVPAGGATQWLPLIVGDRRAREILFLCEEIPAQTALSWGLVNQVVPRAELDRAVDALAAKLHDKLPEVTRYTKQQLNFWRDLSWHLTVGHARDWLTLHAGAPETQEGIEAFREKRPVDYAGIRSRLAAGDRTEYLWGAPLRTCPHCGATRIPEGFTFCGNCGRELATGNRERGTANGRAKTTTQTGRARRRRR